MEPQISILIRARNDEKFIGATLRAVFEQDAVIVLPKRFVDTVYIRVDELHPFSGVAAAGFGRKSVVIVLRVELASGAQLLEVVETADRAAPFLDFSQGGQKHPGQDRDDGDDDQQFDQRESLQV